MIWRWLVISVAMLSSGFASAQAVEPPGYLRWHRAERRVDADLQNWPLQVTLERIAAATGWQVFVEPGLDARVAARFRQRPEREALAAILSDLNFALVPGAQGSTRLLVFRSMSAEATVPIRPPTAEPTPVANTNALARELIVRLKPGATIGIQDLAKALGARVAGSIDSLNAHRLIFDSADAEDIARGTLATHEDVAAVEANYPLGIPAQIDALPGASVPALGLKARPMNDGSSVVVALLDSGIPSSGVANAEYLLPKVSVGDAIAASESGISHGPAMFETILQGLSVTQRAESGQPVRVLPVDIYGGRSETTTFALAQGIVAALERGADVLNLSLSGPNPSPLVQDVLRQAEAAGVLAFGAPGNTPTTNPTYPAAYPEVVAVTASERNGKIAAYANRGSFVDLIAPGTSVVPFAGETYVVNGTSVSTAYAAGLAAGLLADTGKSPSEVVSQMRERLGFTPGPTPVPKP